MHRTRNVTFELRKWREKFIHTVGTYAFILQHHLKTMKLQKQKNKHENTSEGTLFSFEICQSIEILRSYPLIYSEETEPIKQKDLDDSIHVAIKPIACFVQFLFLMPVCGISSDSPKNLQFKWKSFRVLMTLLYILYGLCVSFLYLEFIYDMGINAMNIGN